MYTLTRVSRFVVSCTVSSPGSRRVIGGRYGWNVIFLIFREVRVLGIALVTIVSAITARSSSTFLGHGATFVFATTAAALTRLYYCLIRQTPPPQIFCFWRYVRSPPAGGYST